MKIHVLGSSAGGGLPQWNCGGTFSTRARQGDEDVPRRTQPSIAVSARGERWSVINASPDIRDQFARFEGLHPRPGTRDLPLDKGHDPTYGARPMRRSVEKYLEDPMAEEIIRGDLREGEKTTISAKNDKLVFAQKKAKDKDSKVSG